MLIKWHLQFYCPILGMRLSNFLKYSFAFTSTNDMTVVVIKKAVGYLI